MKKQLNFFFDFPYATIFIFLIFGFLSIFSTIKLMKINTSTESLINQNLDFKINYNNLKKEFKALDKNLLIRISGKNPKKIDEISRNIIQKLEQNEYVEFIYSPNLDNFFKENFFQFLNNNEKNLFLNKLYEYQPFISEMNKNPKLKGFNNILELFIQSGQLDSAKIKEFNKIFVSFINSIEKNEKTKWMKILENKRNENFIICKLDKVFLKKNGFENFYNFLKKIKSIESQDVVIDYTGGLIIDYEEIDSVVNGATIAGFLSVFLVGCLLWIAFKNSLIIISLLVTILIGLTITLGISSLLVGSLNLISVAFAVLFIGLSVDFGIQICSRVLENKNFIEKKIIIKKTNNVSNTLFIAVIPSIVGFISFVPTDYIGISELGIISCIGLIVGLLTNIIFLPCLLILLPLKNKLKKNDNSIYPKSFNFINKKKYLFFSLLILICIYTFFNINQIKFDSDALNLKDQKLNSVKLAKELIEKNPTSDYVISVISDKKDKLNLDIIVDSKNIKSSFSYYNIIEDYSSDELDYLKFLISDTNSNFYSGSDELMRFKNILEKLSNLNLGTISQNCSKLLTLINENEIKNDFFIELQDLFFANFYDLIIFINSIGKVKEDFNEMIPLFYKQRYISESGKYRFEYFPLKDVSKTKNLEDFVEEVTTLYPNATGMPVVQLEAGKIVKNSFMTAFIISISFLTLFIYFVFRNFLFLFLCLFSLLIASILTIFIMIMFNLQFNFANMIALPLLYSLGVSYPIYFLKRFNEFKKVDNVIISSTPKAIIFSAATTTASFATLALSGHNGTSSMGIVLFISMTMNLFSSLIILPMIIKNFKFK